MSQSTSPAWEFTAIRGWDLPVATFLSQCYNFIRVVIFFLVMPARREINWSSLLIQTITSFHTWGLEGNSLTQSNLVSQSVFLFSFKLLGIARCQSLPVTVGAHQIFAVNFLRGYAGWREAICFFCDVSTNFFSTLSHPWSCLMAKFMKSSLKFLFFLSANWRKC